MTKIGDTIWSFDINRRVYPEGKGIGRSPIYSEHFSPHVITGETPKSWIVNEYGKDRKINKITMLESQGQFSPMPWYTSQGRENRIWVHENRYRIIQTVQNSGDVGKLKRIAAILEEK